VLVAIKLEVTGALAFVPGELSGAKKGTRSVMWL
jgi:hypothetical protein